MLEPVSRFPTFQLGALLQCSSEEGAEKPRRRIAGAAFKPVNPRRGQDPGHYRSHPAGCRSPNPRRHRRSPDLHHPLPPCRRPRGGCRSPNPQRRRPGRSPRHKRRRRRRRPRCPAACRYRPGGRSRAQSSCQTRPEHRRCPRPRRIPHSRENAIMPSASSEAPAIAMNLIFMRISFEVTVVRRPGLETRKLLLRASQPLVFISAYAQDSTRTP